MPSNEPATSTFKHKKTFVVVSILCVVTLIVVASFVDTKALHAWAQKVPAWLVFVLMAFLPVVGVPMSLLLVIGGARFGTVGGLIASVFAISINLLLTYWITKFVLRAPIESFFSHRKYKIPQVPKGEYVTVTLLTALIPGLPYAAKNYLLVLAGVPFRFYFWVCLPAYLVSASIGILFGGMTKEMTTGKIIFLVVYALVITFLCRRVVRGLKARNKVTAENLKPEDAVTPS